MSLVFESLHPASDIRSTSSGWPVVNTSNSNFQNSVQAHEPIRSHYQNIWMHSALPNDSEHVREVNSQTHMLQPASSYPEAFPSGWRALPSGQWEENLGRHSWGLASRFPSLGDERGGAVTASPKFLTPESDQQHQVYSGQSHFLRPPCAVQSSGFKFPQSIYL